MKIPAYLISVAASAALLGCKPDSQTSSPPLTNASALKEQAAADLKSAKDSAVQTKDEFLAATEKQMQVLDAKIKDLSDKSANYKDDAKAQSDKLLENLRGQRAVVQMKFDDLKQSSQATWDKTKAAFSAAWSDLEKACDDAKSKFN